MHLNSLIHVDVDVADPQRGTGELQRSLCLRLLSSSGERPHVSPEGESTWGTYNSCSCESERDDSLVRFLNKYLPANVTDVSLSIQAPVVSSPLPSFFCLSPLIVYLVASLPPLLLVHVAASFPHLKGHTLNFNHIISLSFHGANISPGWVTVFGCFDRALRESSCS